MTSTVEAVAWVGAQVGDRRAVAHRTGASSAHAARVVRIARRRQALPVSYGAFREGRLSFDQMYAIARRVPSACDVASVDA